jgi:hypothetical protein
MPSIASEPADWRCETLARASGFAAVFAERLRLSERASNSPSGLSLRRAAGVQFSFWSFFKKGY